MTTATDWPTQRRATVLSVQALASRLLFSIIGPIAGWLADTYSLSASLSIIGLVYLLLGCVGLLYPDRHRDHRRFQF